MADTDVAMSGTGDFELPARKKPKISELPLSGAQRASIDGMLHTFKKKGEFDSLRKKVFQQYNESAQRGMFEASLRTFTTAEIDRDSIKYLKPDRRIAAPLLEGAAARADVYEKTGLDIDAYIEQYVAHAEQALREIRRKEIGDEAAAEEIRRGNKSEESYAADAEQRRAERAKKHVDDEKKRKRQEATERKKKELEALKKKQAELQNETERLQREQKRRAEREAWKAAEKERERERIRKFNEEREKQQKEVEDREKALQEERDRRAKERADREQKRLEAEALDLLLKEGQEMAEKSRRPELERSESMEPPPRLRHQAAPRNSYGKDQMRAQGLMPTSLTLKKGDRPSTDLPASTPTGPADRRPRALSPSPARSYTSRRRNESPDDRRGLPRDRRDNVLREISAEREAWKARQRGSDRDRSDRNRDRDRGMDRGRDDRERERPLGASRGEDGEVVERAQRQAPPPRADSRGSYRPGRRDVTRSPPPARRSIRDRSRTRSPPRRYRERDYSPAPRRRVGDVGDRDRERERDRRSRSPAGIDRYIPGGGAAKDGGEAAGGPPREKERDRDVRPREGDRERERDRERARERDRDRDRNVRDRDRDVRDRERDRDRDRERERDRDRGRDDRGRDDRGRDADRDRGGRDGRRRERFSSVSRIENADRYIPSRGDTAGRRERTRSRSRERDRTDRGGRDDRGRAEDGRGGDRRAGGGQAEDRRPSKDAGGLPPPAEAPAAATKE